jgi:diphthamide biosynthesis protein 3
MLHVLSCLDRQASKTYQELTTLEAFPYPVEIKKIGGLVLLLTTYHRLSLESTQINMADNDELNIYDEIEIEDMIYDATLQIYHYPCPCGDRFEIGLADLWQSEDIGVCPSCSLMIKVIFDMVSTSKCVHGTNKSC